MNTEGLEGVLDYNENDPSELDTLKGVRKNLEYKIAHLETELKDNKALYKELELSKKFQEEQHNEFLLNNAEYINSLQNKIKELEDEIDNYKINITNLNEENNTLKQGRYSDSNIKSFYYKSILYYVLDDTTKSNEYMFTYKNLTGNMDDYTISDIFDTEQVKGFIYNLTREIDSLDTVLDVIVAFCNNKYLLTDRLNINSKVEDESIKYSNRDSNNSINDCSSLGLEKDELDLFKVDIAANEIVSKNTNVNEPLNIFDNTFNEKADKNKDKVIISDTVPYRIAYNNLELFCSHYGIKPFGIEHIDYSYEDNTILTMYDDRYNLDILMLILVKLLNRHVFRDLTDKYCLLEVPRVLGRCNPILNDFIEQVLAEIGYENDLSQQDLMEHLFDYFKNNETSFDKVEKLAEVIQKCYIDKRF